MKIKDKVAYNLKLKEFQEFWALDFGIKNTERITLIILLCNITQDLRKGDSSVKVIDVIEKLIKDDDVGQGLEEFLIKVSFYCESLLSGQQEPFSDLGLKEIKDKVLKIREVTNNFLPF